MKLPFISEPEEITNHDYHNADKFKDFISSSQFDDWLISPKSARYKELNPDEDQEFKPHFVKGSVYHDMLSSLINTGNIEGYKDNWHEFSPPINPLTNKPFGESTKKFQDAVEIAINESGGRELCQTSHVENARKMIDELLNGNPHLSKDINFLIRRGKAEISHFVEYLGQKFKFRTDLETPYKIVDWKTLPKEKAHPLEIFRQIIKFNYHVKAAFYQFFEHEISGKWKSFYWVFQENEPPYDFIIVSADNWAFEIAKDEFGETIPIPKIGAITFMKVLDQYIKCRETSEYLGYSSMIQPGFRGQRILEPKVPIWYENQMFNYFE